MPLKLLKRTSKQYNVVSKSTFVISVILLDNGIMECTLDADSTGNDCLHNISQRLGLHQPEFFGLRYISRGVPPRQRWIELEQPLKKQLEKYAEDSQLSLGVMYYVTDVNFLRDEMGRYHYFLQLKSDVIDGKLNCSIDQAISLAAYSLQAEFGDYDPERHTIEYLRDFAILPKDLTSDEKYRDINIDALFEAVARQYGSLIGFPPPLAEIYYIMVAQQLDGYGQECYPAKDESGNDILICVSVNGLLIRKRDWTHIAAFRWSDIKSLMGHKRVLILESGQSQRTQFHFTDPEVVKYVRKICQLQTTFQKQSLIEQQQNVDRLGSNSTYMGAVGDSFDAMSHSSSNVNLRGTQDLTAPSVMTSIGSQYSLNNNQTGGLNSASNPFPSSHYRQHLLNHSLQELSGSSQMRSLTPNKNIPDTRMNHTHVNGAQLDSDSLLPSYRPAPDYDTAVQLKYSQHHPVSSLGGEASRAQQQRLVQVFYDTKREEEEEPIYQNEIVSKIHSIELRDSREASLPDQKRTPTPEVPREPRAQAQVVPDDSYMYKAPPPYPGTPNPMQQNSNMAVSKPQSSFNAHTDVLTQITSDLKSSSAPFSNDSPPYAYSSQGHNNNQAQASFEHFGGKSIPLNDNFGTRSIINELTKSIGSQITRDYRAAETEKLKASKSPLAESHVQQPGNTKSTDLPLYRKPIDPKIMKEFQGIQKAKANPNFTTAMSRENSKRNRSPNILPYEDNSIHLTPSRQNPGGYINASPLCAEIGEKSWKYLVGQIPLGGIGPGSFWQMIWEYDVQIIVSLERDSTAPFYPPQNSQTLTFGDFQVTDSKSRRINAKASIARELLLTFVQKKKQRRVWVLPYEEEWKDDVPIDTEHFLCFLEEVNSVQRKVSEEGTPLAVVCGTGAGRSGVFVLSDLLLHAADAGHKIRCDGLLSELRSQRMLLVTHPVQYSFVLDTFYMYLAQSRLI